MGWKKEYKCYKGKECEECCKSKVEEAVIHRTYMIMLIISIALLILALTVPVADDTVFVAQVSFASTVTSIILSVIAIWMSITGERSTNEIKIKVSDSADRLVKTADASNELVDNLKKTLNSQNKTYSEIKEQMESVLSEVEGVKTTITELSSSFTDGENTAHTSSVPTQFVFDNIYNGLGDSKRKLLLDIAVEMFNIKEDELSGKKIGNLCREMCEKEFDANVLFGIIISLKHNGFFSQNDNCVKLKDRYKQEL